MGRHTLLLSSVAAAAATGFSHTASGEEAKRPAISVLAYNYAAVPGDTMRHASEKVIRIYRDTGVDVIWSNPLIDPTHATIDSTSNSLRILAVRILIRPKRIAKRTSTPASVMGIALAADDDGGTLSVFYDQVWRVAHKYRQPIVDILALAMAHEIGHMLLPSPGHSSTGIMRAAWDGDGIRHAVLGSLTFTPAQAALIRRKAAACCDAQALNAAK